MYCVACAKESRIVCQVYLIYAKFLLYIYKCISVFVFSFFFSKCIDLFLVRQRKEIAEFPNGFLSGNKVNEFGYTLVMYEHLIESRPYKEIIFLKRRLFRLRKTYEDYRYIYISCYSSYLQFCSR